jgi:hypothetical protein
VIVTVDGTASAPLTVSLAPFAPGIFANGVLNQDYSVNSATAAGRARQHDPDLRHRPLGTGVITANIGSEVVTQPYYAGAGAWIYGIAADRSDSAHRSDRQFGERFRVRRRHGWRR